MISKAYSNHGKPPSLILDIDEDFFGVELPGVKLNKTNVNWEHVDVVNQASSSIICNLKSVIDETRANDLLRRVVLNVLNSCDDDTCYIHSAMDAVKRLRANMKYRYLFCTFTDKETADSTWKAFAESLVALRASDLKLLLKEGWCASTPLRYSDEGITIRLCIGHNTPADYQIPLYTPTLTAIEKRTAQLTKLLGRIHKIGAPTIVTLCRSSKDGYTPRHLQEHIEKSILSAFSAISDRYTVHYDKYLWGGENGWKDRNKLVN